MSDQQTTAPVGGGVAEPPAAKMSPLHFFVFIVGTATISAFAATGVMMLFGEVNSAVVGGVTGAVVATTATSIHSRRAG